MSVRISPSNKQICSLQKDYFKCTPQRNAFRVTVPRNTSGEAKPVYVHLYGIPESETILIDRLYPDDCDVLHEPYRCAGQIQGLACDSPDILLTLPGEYLFYTKSGEFFDPDSFAVEQTKVHAEYAQLWLSQQTLCCCKED